MNKEKAIKDAKTLSLYHQIVELHNNLDEGLMNQFQRSLPFNEEISDRWERARKLGFGKESSIYDSSLVFGTVKVGQNCWIGPFTLIDGSGGLEIGNYCTISAGVHIYTHDNVKQTLSSGKFPIERQQVTIGNNVYIAPNAIITKGVSIGNCCVIGANAFINRDIPNNAIVLGQPGKVVGSVIIGEDESIRLEFNKK